ncbi:sulfite reductase (NADPH) hemoprotein beta-component [Kaistia soli DSM 19436]|uniref:Sulfite reductase (NADPH) hemoprotein beta-component n=1 Tax=Kaistia soli DSM 19436 TaxID=1122133 RepID=A0A1M4XUV8_9HYPH|nr:nitrite/sulfite reductase [Kaistia soli]SHE97367.1 sulfite reductase (NADPH) hemoprotein beta-component [Kaistia soli DSM 19436]
MYRYDEFDQDFVTDRVAQFRDQVERRLSGELTEDQFKPLRLMNGVYLQLHAYMLRIAVPYGTLDSRQMRKLGDIARRYDRGYGHFTTRQNLQFNWPKLSDIPDILAELASVEMHAIQTSGNCIRNVTADHFAGAAADEVADPRPYAEILRQWSSLHPEFVFLPRKFKVAVTGAERDRAAIQVHDIGLHLKKDENGRLGFAVYIGGGQGRTPMIAKKIRDFLPEEDLLSYSEAILRVYNLNGRRDNKYKARIKILVHETGAGEIARQVEEEWERIRHGALKLPQGEVERIREYFAAPAGLAAKAPSASLASARQADPEFDAWVRQNTFPHRVAGHVSATISLKPIGGTPGDATADQMDVVADLAERFAFDEIRVSHEQNLILPHVAEDNLRAVYDGLVAAGLATANAGLVTDIIACPGLDYCALANARSIPVAQRISQRFGDIGRQREIGELKIKISGCINACGHHHVGHIGILGVEKKGEEFYQISLGGSGDENSAIGDIIGRGFSTDEIVDAVETIVDTYIARREAPEETFLAAYRRLGQGPFKEALYGTA